VSGKKRVLDSSLGYKEQTLLLLYSEPETAVPAEELFEWTEHPLMKNYRRDVLNKLHADRFIEYDRESEMITLSPRVHRKSRKRSSPRSRRGSFRPQSDNLIL
jgi:hypothetical protein